ncbi:MAG: hypothetical protein R6X05_05865 [Desulfobacterales bacterium]
MAVSMIGFNRSVGAGFAVDGSRGRGGKDRPRKIVVVLRTAGLRAKIGFSG